MKSNTRRIADQPHICHFERDRNALVRISESKNLVVANCFSDVARRVISLLG